MQRIIDEMSSLKLSASSRCVKYLMFAFNLLFVISGIILVSIGATIHAVYSNYEHFLDHKFLSVPNLLIAIGSIIFIIAFFGCCGAVRENYCMIVTFASFMVLIFILELSGGISGYVLRNHAADVVGDKMIETMKEYKSNVTAPVWDHLQRDFECCGTRNATDWLQYLDNKLPMSCCESQTGVIGAAICDMDSPNLHKQGCFPEFLIFIKAHAVQLGGVGLGIAFVQAVGIWFAIFLAKSIKSSYETV